MGGGEQWGRAEESCSSHSSLSEDDSCSLDPLPDYQQFTGSKDLLASLAPSIPFSSPYLQSPRPPCPPPLPTTQNLVLQPKVQRQVQVAAARLTATWASIVTPMASVIGTTQAAIPMMRPGCEGSPQMLAARS